LRGLLARRQTVLSARTIAIGFVNRVASPMTCLPGMSSALESGVRPRSFAEFLRHLCLAVADLPAVDDHIMLVSAVGDLEGAKGEIIEVYLRKALPSTTDRRILSFMASRSTATRSSVATEARSHPSRTSPQIIRDGEDVLQCHRNKPVARIVPWPAKPLRAGAPIGRS
jgi:hypothetical protein